MATEELLRRLRNELPMGVTLRLLGREGPPFKHYVFGQKCDDNSARNKFCP